MNNQSEAPTIESLQAEIVRLNDLNFSLVVENDNLRDSLATVQRDKHRYREDYERLMAERHKPKEPAPAGDLDFCDKCGSWHEQGVLTVCALHRARDSILGIEEPTGPLMPNPARPWSRK